MQVQRKFIPRYGIIEERSPNLGTLYSNLYFRTNGPDVYFHEVRNGDRRNRSIGIYELNGSCFFVILKSHLLNGKVNDQFSARNRCEGKFVGFAVELRKTDAGVQNLPDIGMGGRRGVMLLYLPADIWRGDGVNGIIRVFLC